MTETKKRGRPAMLEHQDVIVEELSSIGTDSPPSYFKLRKLAKAGYVEFIPAKTGTKGRPKLDPVLTEKGQVMITEKELIDRSKEFLSTLVSAE